MKRVKAILSRPIVSALQDELDYQSDLPSDRADRKDHGLAGQLVTLDRYVRKTLDAWTDNAGETEALDNLRKVAAIAIRALYLFGFPRRQVKGSWHRGSVPPMAGGNEIPANSPIYPRYVAAMDPADPKGDVTVAQVIPGGRPSYVMCGHCQVNVDRNLWEGHIDSFDHRFNKRRNYAKAYRANPKTGFTDKMLVDFVNRLVNPLGYQLHGSKLIELSVTDCRSATDIGFPCYYKTDSCPICKTPPCPDCQKPMKQRIGQHGLFWGCSDYPECTGTRDFPNYWTSHGDEITDRLTISKLRADVRRADLVIDGKDKALKSFEKRHEESIKRQNDLIARVKRAEEALETIAISHGDADERLIELRRRYDQVTKANATLHRRIDFLTHEEIPQFQKALERYREVTQKQRRRNMTIVRLLRRAVDLIGIGVFSFEAKNQVRKLNKEIDQEIKFLR